MKKIILIMFAALLSANVASAQDFKGFLSDVKYNLSVGLTITGCDKEYDQNRLGWGLGLDAQKPILHYPNDASTIYGLAGLHLDKKGGKNTTDFMAMLEDDDAYLSATHLKIPVHAGFTYQFSKISLFIDLGPYFAFKVGDNTPQNVETSSMELGYGAMLGIKFKRFAFAFGSDQGLTNFATLTSGEDKTNMKNTTGHLDLRWTL